jgi:hypothetical protein
MKVKISVSSNTFCRPNGPGVAKQGQEVDVVVKGLDLVPGHQIPVYGFQIIGGDGLETILS